MTWKAHYEADALERRRERQREYQRVKRAALRAIGLCTECKAPATKSLCVACQEYHYKANQRHKLRKAATCQN